MIQTKRKGRAGLRGLSNNGLAVLTLAGFEPALRLVDHVDAAFATHNAAITMPVLERAERIADLHGLSPVPAARASALFLRGLSGDRR
jgi:hypothetical protein